MLHSQWEERLIHYQYIQELLEDRRVLEIGCGSGLGARFLADLASQVLVVEPSDSEVESCQSRVDLPNVQWLVSEPDRLKLETHSIDVVLVPELHRWVARGALLPEIQRILVPGGVALFAVPSGDRDNNSGMAFDDLQEYLTHSFEHVRLMGEIPFFGKIVADFDPDEELDPQLDCSLVSEDELPLFYLGLCSRKPLESLGYTVLQVPKEGVQQVERLPLSERTLSVMESWTESETAPQPAFAPSRATEPRQLSVLERLLDRESARADALEERLQQERNRLERERLRVEELNGRILEDRGKVEGERVRAEVAERALEEWRLAVEEQRNRAEAAERRCDSLLIRLEQGAAELSNIHHQMAELQGLRQADQWQIDELTGRLRQQEMEQTGQARAVSGAPGQRVPEAEQRAAELEQRAAELEQRVPELEQRAAEAEVRASKSEKQAVEAEHRASAATRQAEEIGKRLARVERRVQELEQQAVQQQEEKSELERELMRSESRVTEQSRRATNAESKIVQLEVRLKRSESEAATLSKWAEELREELKEAQGKSSARPETPEPEVAALRNDLQQARQRNLDLEQRCDRFIKEAEHYRAQLEEKDRALQEALRAVDADLLQEAMQLRQQCEELSDLKEQHSRTLDELERVHDQLRDAEQAETELKRTRRELESLRVRVRDIDAASEELEQLRMAAMHHRDIERELEAARIELARYEDELRGLTSGIGEEMPIEEEEGEEAYEGYVGEEMEGVLGAGDDEGEWEMDERIRVREHQIEALLEGAALHREEMEQHEAQLAEMSALVTELEHQHQTLEKMLADCDRRLAEEQKQGQQARDENLRLGRELARVQGELKRCQELRTQLAGDPGMEVPPREDLEREIRLRQKLQEDLESRLVELDELRKEHRNKDKAMDRLRAEDTEHRAELRELRRQVRDMERQVATWREALGEREQRIRGLEGQLSQVAARGETAPEPDHSAKLEKLGLKLNRALQEARQLETRLEQERDLRAQANLEIARRQAEIERQKEQLCEADTHVECMREELHKSQALMGAAERRLAQAEEQRDQAKLEIQDLQRELVLCQERTRKLETKLSERKERIKQLKRTLEHEQRLDTAPGPRRPEEGPT